MRLATTGVAFLCTALPLSTQTYREPSTNVEFPASLTPPGGSATQTLTGTGVRTRTMLKVKVYAFGLYVDPAGAKSALAPWAGKSTADLQRDDAFYAKLLERSFPMSLLLVMTRDVDGATMAEAFDGQLRPRVTEAAGRGMIGGAAALDQFRGYFSDRVTSGTVLVFSCTPEGRFTTSIGGQAKPELQSAALCWALFDVYLGRKPISPDGKKTVIASIPGVIR